MKYLLDYGGRNHCRLRSLIKQGKQDDDETPPIVISASRQSKDNRVRCFSGKPKAEGKVMFNQQHLNPESSLRATPNHETNQNPKYFPIYFIFVQNSRVSFKDPKDGKM